MAESWRGAEEPLDEGERGDWKAGLKRNIQKTNIMASCSITSCQTEGEKMEAMTDFTSWAPKSLWMVTSAMNLKDACSLGERPRHHIKKRHDFAEKDLYSQCYVLLFFPVVLYEWESWIIKKALHWKIGAFELWYWTRLLGIPWTAWKSSQSIL